MIEKFFSLKWGWQALILYFIGAMIYHIATAEQTPYKAPPEKIKAEAKDTKAQDRLVFLAHGMVKENMKRPDSVQWTGTLVFHDATCVTFKAKNSFGDTIDGIAVLSIQKFAINDTQAWDKYCLGSNYVRYY
jgi:hypothetical protein